MVDPAEYEREDARIVKVERDQAIEMGKMIDKEIDMLEQTDRREPNEAPGLHRGHDDVKDRQGDSEQDGAISVKHLDRLEHSEDLFAQLFNSCGADCGYGILRLEYMCEEFR